MWLHSYDIVFYNNGMDIVASIAIIGLVGLLGFNGWLHYRERIEITKIDKAKNVSEIEYLVPGKTPKDEEPDVDPLVSLENMPDLDEERE